MAVEDVHPDLLTVEHERLARQRAGEHRERLDAAAVALGERELAVVVVVVRHAHDERVGHARVRHELRVEQRVVDRADRLAPQPTSPSSG